MICMAFVSEWIKLRRRTLLIGIYTAIAGVAALVTTLTFARAEPDGQNPAEAGVSRAELAAPSGLAYGLIRATTLLGVVALAVAAAQLASEYSHGTLRNLLIRQPRRLVLLAGKFAAVLTFMVGAVVVATIAGAIAAFIMAPVEGIGTEAWTSATGLLDLGHSLVNVAVAIVGYATLGTLLAAWLRSPVAAIAVGVAYVLPFETLVAEALDDAARWLPVQLLDALAQGGTAEVGYAAAILTTGLYLLVAAVLSGALFTRRDVTA
jgi:ABC-2 type transport system permease protein